MPTKQNSRKLRGIEEAERKTRKSCIYLERE
jgi:hypothetical protein